MKLNNPQGITNFNPEVIATTCSPRHVQSVLEDCKAVMKECEYWILKYNRNPESQQVKDGLEQCLKALQGELSK